MAEEETEFRGIVRVANKDLKGELPLPKALSRIRGIGINLADSVACAAERELGIDKNEKIGNLTDEQIKALEKILEAPSEHGIPDWMLNRRRDVATDRNMHLISSDLEFQQRKDTQTEKNMRSYRGVRHMFNLAVRGQRTKTWGRRGMTMGVMKKKQQPAKKKKGTGGGAKKGGKKGGKKK